MTTATKNNNERAKAAPVADAEPAPAVEILPDDPPEDSLPSKPSPIVAPPRVIVEMEAFGEHVAEVKKFGNVLLQIAGLEGNSRAVQWLADAVDAANRFVIDLKEQKGVVKLAPHTIFRAIKNAAGLGLSFNRTLGQLYLVPFKNGALSGRDGDVYDCVLIVGYQGYEALAYGLGWLDSLFVEVVLADEIDDAGSRFQFWHDEQGPHIIHRPKLPRIVPRAMKEAQSVIDLGYASWRTTRGTVGVAVADRGRIARAVKPASDMWRWDFPAGVKKTAIREAAKHWKKSRLLSGALMLDDQAEREVEQDDITGRRIPEIDDGLILPTGPPPGGVAGLGDDDADESPAFLDLSRRVEERREPPQATEQAIASALQAGTIDDDQAGRLSDRLADVAATPKPTETLDSDEIPW